MRDSEFLRGKVPMTKEEIRTIVLSKLELRGDDTLLDIGAGTGSVSIEAALNLPNGNVIAIEQKEEAIELINQNINRYKLSNLKLIHAKAPEGMGDIEHINKYFIGGSGGNLIDILGLLSKRAPSESIIVITAIVLDTMYKAYQFFKENNYDFELIQVSVNKMDTEKKAPMLIAQNPIFIITARKNKK
jgi:cobalt-precorrin-6B (C15)-methyltransferase